MRVLASHLWIAAVLLSVVMISCGREEPEEQKKPEDFDVNEWENTDIDGDASMASRMIFSIGDTIQVEGKVTMRASYSEVEGVEKCLLDENDIVTIEVSGGTGSTRSAVKKNYVVGKNHTSLSYYEGSPSLNEFHWDYGTEKINIRAWSYGGAVADNTAPITDPDGQVISIEKNQKENGYKELLYSPLQTDLAYPTAKSGISLPLYHQMARVVVTLGKKATDDAATVSNVTIGDGTVSIPVSGKFTKPSSGNTTGTWGNITKTAAVIQMKEEVANVKYSAVVVPENYPKDMKFIYVTMSDGNKYAYTISNENGIDLAAGKQYNFTISLGDDVATLQAVYPTEWTAAGFPVTNYTSTEQFGMYAVNSSGDLVYANEPMTIARISETTATLCASASIANKLSTSYNYYIYYPYKSTYNASSVDMTKTNAVDFFASMISGWTTDASQGTTDALRKNDLQVGKIAGDGLKTHTLTAAAMTHKAGLLVITLAKRTVPTVQYFNSSNSILSGNTDGTTTDIWASSTFSTNIPYVNSIAKKCYAVIRESGRTFKGTGQDEWTAGYTTPTVTAGSVYTHTASTIKRTFIKKGWVYNFTNGIQSLSVTQAGSYKLEVWGAQGGDSFGYVSDTGASTEKNQHAGGLGGYSYGSCNGSAGQTLFVVVGGSGKKLGHKAYDSPNTTTTENGGGYNGGAAPTGLWDYHGDHYNGGGGGATHIARTSGVLETLSDKKEQILIVAGGGGGSGWYMCNVNKYGTSGPGYHYGWGGSGGGNAGGNSTNVYSDNSWPHPTTGTGEHNPSPALGGNASGNTTNFGKGVGGANGCGGGGYYGGLAGTGGGGGSGYIGGVTGGATSNGVREGNGYARITTNFEWIF